MLAFVSAGEGYECAVTVDDEDSKIVVFDNWKQVSELPALLGTLCLFVRFLFATLCCEFMAWTQIGAANEPVVIGGRVKT